MVFCNNTWHGMSLFDGHNTIRYHSMTAWSQHAHSATTQKSIATHLTVIVCCKCNHWKQKQLGNFCHIKTYTQLNCPRITSFITFPIINHTRFNVETQGDQGHHQDTFAFMRTGSRSFLGWLSEKHNSSYLSIKEITPAKKLTKKVLQTLRTHATFRSTLFPHSASSIHFPVVNHPRVNVNMAKNKDCSHHRVTSTFMMTYSRRLFG